MGIDEIKKEIEEGKTCLGIELGSTRIKAVLIGTDHAPCAEGSYEWENEYVDGVWSYSNENILKGLQGCYSDLAENVYEKYGAELTDLAGMGVSAMMHGYLAFNKDDELLVPFRTWRNTITEEAAAKLTELFNYNIPQRWSIAHLYQAILNGEDHIKDISFITTLSGYVHYLLTGRHVIGIGDGSGMFPIDIEKKDFSERMLNAFDDLIKDKDLPWKIRDILPDNLVAGENAGQLTEEGVKLLDANGKLKAGIPLCPPEGDAGTGMIATNSIKVKTGNVSAGTSAFAMLVLEKDLSKVYEEIDMVTTPDGSLVAMAHCNNCTSDINAWVDMYEEFTDLMGIDVPKGKLYEKLFNKALEGDYDCGGLISCNWFAGEPVVHTSKGTPMYTRPADAKVSLANFIRSHIYGSIAVIKIGMDLLLKNEGVKAENMMAHGGLFKTPEVGQRILAAAFNTPVTVMPTAGEGGAWGIALLASYMANGEGMKLEDYLDEKVFAGSEGVTIAPDPDEVAGFEAYMEKYRKLIPSESAAAEVF